MNERLLSFAKQNKKTLIPAGILVGGLIVVLFVYLIGVYPTTKAFTVKDAVGRTADIATQSLENGQRVQQRFSYEGELSGYKFMAGTHGNNIEEIVVHSSIRDTQSGQIIINEECDIPLLSDNEYLEITFESSHQLPKGQYEIEVVFEGLQPGDQLSLWLSEGIKEQCNVNDEQQQGSMLILFYGLSSFLTIFYWCIALPLVVFLSVLGYMLIVRKAKIQNVFVVAALGLGVMYMFVYPPYAVNDEADHIPNTFYFSSQLLGGAEIRKGSFENRAEDNMDGYTILQPNRDQFYHTYANLLETEQEPDAVIETEIRFASHAYQYAPAVIGVTFARLLHLGQVPTLYMGRIFMLVAFVIVMYFTLRITPFKTLFALLGLLPFVLHITGSFSYDMCIIALCFLFASYVFHLSYVKDRMTVPDIIILAVVGLLIAPLKYVYVPILLLPLIIPKGKWIKPFLKKIFCLLLVVGGAAILLMYVYRLAANGTFALTEGTTPWNEPSYTYGYLIKHPVLLARLLLFTFFDGLDVFITASGTFQYNSLPLWLSCTALVLVVLSVFPVKGESPLAVSRWQKAVMGVSSFGVYSLALVAALPWTYVGAYYIQGVQGRYFIVLLPLICLLFYGLVQRKKTTNDALIFGMTLINFYGVLYLFLTISNNRLPSRFL